MEEIEALEIHRSYSGMKPSKKILYAGVGMVCLTLLFGCGDDSNLFVDRDQADERPSVDGQLSPAELRESEYALILDGDLEVAPVERLEDGSVEIGEFDTRGNVKVVEGKIETIEIFWVAETYRYKLSDYESSTWDDRTKDLYFESVEYDVWLSKEENSMILVSVMDMSTVPIIVTRWMLRKTQNK